MWNREIVTLVGSAVGLVATASLVLVWWAAYLNPVQWQILVMWNNVNEGLIEGVFLHLGLVVIASSAAMSFTRVVRLGTTRTARQPRLASRDS